MHVLGRISPYPPVPTHTCTYFGVPTHILPDLHPFPFPLLPLHPTSHRLRLTLVDAPPLRLRLRFVPLHVRIVGVIVYLIIDSLQYS